MPYADPEKRREYQRKYQSRWSKANPDKKYHYWLKRDKKRISAYMREWRVKNREKVLAYNKAWFEAHADVYYCDVGVRQRRMVNTARARAKASGIPFSITVDDIQWPTHCPAFGLELDYINRGRHKHNSASLDRIVPEVGYIPGNVIVLSLRANILKRDATISEICALADFLRGLPQA